MLKFCAGFIFFSMLVIEPKIVKCNIDDDDGYFGTFQDDEAMKRIINGRVVDISDYPYQVGLVQTHPFNPRLKRIICGGSIIKPKIIFTAAHCTFATDDEPRPALSVLVGANSLRDPEGTLYSIEKVVKHPEYTFRGYDNDFSVIVLKKPVQYGDRVKNIEISMDEHDGGTVAVASGWGRTETGRPSKYLRAADLTVEQWDKCQDYFPKVFHPTITKNMICVKPSSETTYYGDSGGPLVVDGKLTGLVSFGRRLKEDEKITVFTRVKNFLDFVEESVPEFKDD